MFFFFGGKEEEEEEKEEKGEYNERKGKGLIAGYQGVRASDLGPSDRESG